MPDKIAFLQVKQTQQRVCRYDNVGLRCVVLERWAGNIVPPTRPTSQSSGSRHGGAAWLSSCRRSAKMPGRAGGGLAPGPSTRQARSVRGRTFKRAAAANGRDSTELQGQIRGRASSGWEAGDAHFSSGFRRSQACSASRSCATRLHRPSHSLDKIKYS